MDEYKYWRVVCRYGHVGKKKEVSVPRYLQTDNNCVLMDVLEIVSEMPGVKKNNTILYSVASAKAINKKEYESGKEAEKENFYLQKLMRFNKKTEAIIA
ncbi:MULTISPECIES: hypothetical protein [Rossellomorea]|uniref:Uncharacterized protein n=1 Tax=Rossellomorea vietnamensis TaxID=218284 RepID=A0A0P6VY87_9BACI|nr:hypothetical protein [Rossellomorea vietnamensis]KPL57823.1 hypothetical protein AM506_19935 [Rossellomorea vietnamensis]